MNVKIEEAESTADMQPGRSEYVQARKLQHHSIPDFDTDGEYMTLLGESAEKGYPRALAKLGEYAIRRHAWVEAYYWMWRSRQAGGTNMERILYSIRRCWVEEGYPNQSSNVHDLFSEEESSIGRALLDLDSGHDVHSAKEFLTAHYPEFLGLKAKNEDE